MPNLIVKRQYVFSAIGLLISLGITISQGYKAIPALQLLSANCTEPTQDKVQCVEGEISRINSGKSSYTAYQFIYENSSYEIQDDYLSRARKGMKAKIYIKKGSRGIPIVQDIEIPAIGWSLTKGYYAPPEQYAAEPRKPVTNKKGTDKKGTYKQEAPAKGNNSSSKIKPATGTWSEAYPWTMKPLNVKGNEMGVWKLLAPEWPQHHFYSHYLSMHIAIQEDDGKAMLLFYDEMNSKYYPANIRSVVTVETDGLTNRYQVAPDNYLSGTVWLFGSNDARKFIKQVANSPQFTINCTSKEDNTVKAYTFIVSQDKKSE